MGLGNGGSAAEVVFRSKNPQRLLQFVNDEVIGKDATFVGPFGEKKVVYCDYTASGRALQYMEDFVANHVQPFYANTHTTTSVCGLQTSAYREDARAIIKAAVNAGDDDVAIFVGNGVTGAVHKLIGALQLRRGDRARNTVVLVGPYEHHSNILPWKMLGCRVIHIDDTDNGVVDTDQLAATLAEQSKTGKSVIISMSAASNVTGIFTDVDGVSELAHRHGALVLWDYATAGPYVNIDMNPAGKELSYKDAVFLSPHKFVGGVACPGLLIAKKKLFQNAVPDGVGGGTVNFVTKEKHEFYVNIEEREEGGTPAIVGAIRCGLIFQLKHAISEAVIEEREHELAKRAFQKWRHNNCIHILGSYTARRLPIFSMLLFQKDAKRFLHHNFVCQLLNDLYGIQARGGCACAGPYAEELLGMDEGTATMFAEKFLSQETHKTESEKMEIMKPGFARLNLPFFMPDEVLDFVINAVDAVATHGWKLLPLYKYNVHNGSWIYRGSQKIAGSLMDIDLSTGVCKTNFPTSMKISGSVDLKTVASEADAVFERAQELAEQTDVEQDENMPLPTDLLDKVWFLTPKQAYQLMKNQTLGLIISDFYELPFWPQRKSNDKAKEHFRDAIKRVKIEALTAKVRETERQLEEEKAKEAERRQKRLPNAEKSHNNNNANGVNDSDAEESGNGKAGNGKSHGGKHGKKHGKEECAVM